MAFPFLTHEKRTHSSFHTMMNQHSSWPKSNEDIESEWMRVTVWGKFSLNVDRCARMIGVAL